MNQRLSYGKVAPAVYKAILALQDTVDKSGLEKDLIDLVCLRISQVSPVHINTKRAPIDLRNA